MAKQTFEEWMARVNQLMDNYCGMVSEDLPDWCYRDAYDDGRTPGAAAREAIAAARDY